MKEGAASWGHLQLGRFCDRTPGGEGPDVGEGGGRDRLTAGHEGYKDRAKKEV